MQQADPVAEPAQQRGDVLPAGGRPVGVDLQDGGRVQQVGQHLQGGDAVEERGEFELVVVVADPDAVLGGGPDGGVEFVREGGDRVAVGQPLGAA